MVKFLDGATESRFDGLSELLSWHSFHEEHGLRKSPCIMCVQYRGGCSVLWGVFSTVGGYHEYRGGIS